MDNAIPSHQQQSQHHLSRGCSVTIPGSSANHTPPALGTNQPETLTPNVDNLELTVLYIAIGQENTSKSLVSNNLAEQSGNLFFDFSRLD
jgi:hypothetical protein